MPRTEQLSRRVEQALRAVVSLHHSGALPPVLQPLLAIAPPTGMDPVVILNDKHDRESFDDDNASPHAWDAQHGDVSVTYVARQHAARDSESGDPIPDLVEVLHDAERNPQLHFVALKFLRDRLLPQSEYAWTRSPQTCQRAIADAIESGILATSKKPNPRNPAFPVTAVELNHGHSAVRRLLGDRAAEEGTGSPQAMSLEAAPGMTAEQT